MTFRKNLLLSVLSGLLLVLAYPVFPFPVLSFVSLVPLLFIFEQEKRPSKKMLLTYISFFIYHGGTNWWISSWQANTDPYLFASGFAVSIIHPFFFLVPFGFYFFIKKRLGSKKTIYLFPFLWVSFEWLHGFGDLAYPWHSLGYSQIYNFYWVQTADLIGVLGLSFVIAFINVLFLKVLTDWKNYKGMDVARILKSRGFLIRTSVLVLLIILPFIYGFIRVKDFGHQELLNNNESITIGLIQPDIDPWDKWSVNVYGMIKDHQRISDSLINSYGDIDLIIWSETAIPFLNLNFNEKHNFNFLYDWIDSRNTSLLTGFADFYIYKPGEEPSVVAKTFPDEPDKKFDTYNSALLLSNPSISGDSSQIYRKMRLTPFGEHIPYVDVFFFTRSFLEWSVGISSWNKGSDQHNLVLRTQNARAEIGTIICIESIFPGFVADFTDKGANILAVITNDAWYDHTPGPEQHYLISAMRAIENRRYLARCANSGVSGFISPCGETIKRAPQYTAQGIATRIPLITEKSIYTMTGDWIPMISLIISILAIVYSFFLKRKNR